MLGHVTMLNMPVKVPIKNIVPILLLIFTCSSPDRYCSVNLLLIVWNAPYKKFF